MNLSVLKDIDKVVKTGKTIVGIIGAAGLAYFTVKGEVKGE
ncbi:MAG: hypothetical protein [Caudoviricetes sp.]|nr:MAG: hypothetical protein [Caudoviricetes sp.]